MVISHKYKLIFIRCRKTASTSVQEALSRISGELDTISPFDDKDIDNSKHAKNNWCYIPSRKPVFYNHIPAFRVREMIWYMSRDIWDTYFKFCFERNPWDKAISEYYHSQQGGTEKGLTLNQFLFNNGFPRYSSWRLYTEEDKSKVIVDKIFKYEEMDKSIQYLIKRCNLPKDFKLSNHRFKGTFREDHRHYREVLTEEENQRIADVHQNIIDYMGYEY